MPKRFTQRIMRVLTREDYKGLRARDLARALRVPDEERGIFSEAVEQLKRDGKLVVGGRGVVGLPEIADQVVGTFQASSKGFGFIRPDTAMAQGDLYIPAGESLDAISGDKVVANVTRRGTRDGQRRYAGRIVEVLNRRETQFVGTLRREKKQWFVQPDGKLLTEVIAVDDPGAKNAKSGDKVVVEVLSFPNQNYYANGVIIERLGKSGTSATELKGVIKRYKLDDKFSHSSLRETRQAVDGFIVADEIARKGPAQREDIRDQAIITIDPKDARDFDDAISIKRLPHGHWKLGVHIADVSHFVKPGGHLDKQAQLRGTSVYLPQHVIPMLPELLSNGVCSLQEGQDRLVKSAYIKLDENGRVLGTRFANSVIRSTLRLTYEDVDHILDGKKGGFDKRIISLIGKMEELAQILQKRRRKMGMLEMELPKAELIYDEHGRVIDAQPESTSFSHTMIEMFMVEANEAVARLLDSIKVPFLRRVHPEPDSLAAGEMSKVIKLCGYIIPKDVDRIGIQKLLASARGKPESFIINLAILKSMQKAEYSPATIGHYALASLHYCHFTSPIRRYPDLTVHRLLQAWLDGSLTEKTVSDFAVFDKMEELGAHCSERERNAGSAEDDLRTVKLLQMLSRHIGDDVMGVVTTITNFGVFVQLEKYLFEGLMTAEDISRQLSAARHGKKKKSFTRNSRHSRNQKGGRRRFIDTCPYKPGQEIRVRIAGVNVPGRTLDLIGLPKAGGK